MSNKSEFAAFKKGLTKFAEKIVPNIVQQVQAQIAYRVYGSVKFLTPVLTGHARHNWIVSMDVPWMEEVEGVFAEDGATNDPLTAFEINHWETMQRKLMNTPMGTTVWISNNVPYIMDLEQGYSQKAPAGMVEVSLHGVLEDVNSRGVGVNVGG